MLNLFQHLLKGVQIIFRCSVQHLWLRLFKLYFVVLFSIVVAFIQIIIRCSIQQTLKQVQGDGSG